MAKTRFILQGFTSANHLSEVKRIFEVPSLQRSIVSVAYMNKGGVAVLRQPLLHYGSKIALFAGVRNPITTYEAVRAAFDTGVDLTAVDMGSTRVAFHPKLYYARGASEARLMVGSANLTPGGLNNNVEASLSTVLDLSDPDDLQICNDVEAGFDSLHTQYPSHVLRLNTIAQIDGLKATGRLFDESMCVKPTPNLSIIEDPEGDNTPPIVLKTQPLNLPVQPKGPGKGKAPVPKPGPVDMPPFGSGYDLVWESKPLTERDLTIPTQANTNPTGSMNLDKGLMAAETDHRHYFHDDVFSALAWSEKNSTVVEAFAPFTAVLKGVNVGVFTLAIRHTTSTDTKSYKQRNAMTRLSWGQLASEVRKTDLLGRTARLYRAVANPGAFLIEID